MVKNGLRCAGASDPGRVRSNNEDALHLDPDRGIFLVVDGIGGQAAGEKAAQIAISRIRARLERQTGTAEQRMREAIAMANNEILRTSRNNPEWRGMACVLTAVVLENGDAVVGHVGDSRLYQIRRGEIRKITHDHSPVGEREDAGDLDEAQAMRHPRRNEVFRDVGSEEHAPDDREFIEIESFPFEHDTALLLCSDGLSDQVTSAEIQRLVENNASRPETAVHELIEAANRAGGKDNVTVVLVQGENFTAPARTAETDRARVFASRSAMLGYGVLAGLAASLLVLRAPPTVTVTSDPVIWTVGPGAKFSKIGEAMAAAKPGDTVEVLPGEYREQVRLAAGVTLRSRVTGDAILRAGPASNEPAVAAADIGGARFVGFRILADPQIPLSEGILLTNSAVEVEDVEIAGAGIGIEIRGETNPLLRGNTIRDCAGEGVLITGPSAPWLSHNVIQRNKGAGLAAKDGARPVIVSNVFEKNLVDVPADLMDTLKAQNFMIDTPRLARPRPVQERKKP